MIGVEEGVEEGRESQRGKRPKKGWSQQTEEEAQTITHTDFLSSNTFLNG